MSTRCIICVKDDAEAFHIYRHSDGYPEGPHGVIAGLQASRKIGWPDGRFEPDEAAASIVAAMKTGPGGIRFATAEGACDAAYWYDVTGKPQGWHVKVYETDSDGKKKGRPIHAGLLATLFCVERLNDAA